jgi:hypothetical protein
LVGVGGGGDGGGSELDFGFGGDEVGEGEARPLIVGRALYPDTKALTVDLRSGDLQLNNSRVLVLVPAETEADLGGLEERGWVCCIVSDILLISKIVVGGSSHNTCVNTIRDL